MADTNQDLGPFKAGRPYAITDPQKLRATIDAYFKMCDPHLERRLADSGRDAKGETIWQEREVMTHQKPYTMSGLARAIGINRSTLLAYKDAAHFSDEIPEDVRQQLIDSVADALARCEEFAEDNLFGPFSAGAKFNLTNNYKHWADKTVQEHGGGFFGQGGRLEVEIVNPESSPDESAQAEAESNPEPGPTPSS